jgi:hypothetical protein
MDVAIGDLFAATIGSRDRLHVIPPRGSHSSSFAPAWPRTVADATAMFVSAPAACNMEPTETR